MRTATRLFAVSAVVLLGGLRCELSGRTHAEQSCTEACGVLLACGVLPSILGDAPQNAEANCRARCRLSETAARDSLLACVESVELAEGEEPARAWCPTLAGTDCSAMAQCMVELFGDRSAVGHGTLRVEVDSSPIEGGECCTDPGCPAGSVGPCAPIGAMCDHAQMNQLPDLADGGDPDPDAVSPCTTLQVGEARIRTEGWAGASAWRTVGCGDLLDGVTLDEVPAGTTQAVIELSGTFPDPGQLTPEGAPWGPPGGLTGPYCWQFRSEALALVSGERPSIRVRLPSSAAATVARAFGQADTDAAKLTGEPVLARCESTAAACRNGVDEDLDGLTDCADPDCASGCGGEENSIRLCEDGIDQDADGLVDCADPDCTAFCETTAMHCRDGIDNDGDGNVDCFDDDCRGVCPPNAAGGRFLPGDEAPAPGEGPTPCEECTTTRCAWRCGIEPRLACHNTIDDDGDGLTDGADPDCAGAGLGRPGPRESNAVQCADGLDNDGNGRADCDDCGCRCSGLCGATASACEC